MSTARATEPVQLTPDPTGADGALGTISREVGIGMGWGLVLAGMLAAILRMFVPQLADLDAGGTLVYVLVASFFGMIPGMVVGVGVGEARLRGR